MDYKILDYACSTQETGPEYPQVQKMGKDYNYHSPDSIYEVARHTTELPAIAPNLDHFVLHRRAKATDLISNTLTRTTGFITSDRFKKLLKPFNLPAHKFYHAKILHGKTLLEDYYWLQIVPDLSSFVDYSRSKFFIKNMADVISGELEAIKLLSKKDYEVRQMELRSKDSNLAIWAKSIVMNDAFDNGLDLFKVSRFNSDFFISDRLSQAIKKACLTGIAIKPAELLDVARS